ncbi:hypothetical protein LOTGIDRAFT_237712 [Lottia gigantea]|uniref:Uncharacterized protein n=1 Tax=Lottia gigantea TaxID=225164 RepID=V4CM73_LOTGI|nr:hypothetical protein LOTGIDRAFT_237712 [Lottia gigantea]ESP03405.1 hypothetical protein LOTGIDRAFT_237712 [Lottia gigantea]
MGNWISSLTSYVPGFLTNQKAVSETNENVPVNEVVRVSPPTDIEISTECARTLYQAETCRKKSQHSDYIQFCKLTPTDIPEQFQNDRLYKYLVNVGKRVVRVTVHASELDSFYGSGVVTKYRGQTVIAVPRSLVPNDTTASQTEVDFFYDTSDYKGVFKSKGTGLISVPDNPQLTLMTFDPEPEVICKSYIPDIDRFKVEVTVTDEEDNLRSGEAEVFTEDGQYYVLTNTDLIDTDFQAENCQIKFCIDGALAPSLGTGIFYMDETDTIISFDPVPEVIKRELTKRDPLWQNSEDSDIMPIVISHPHGAPKTVTMGTAFTNIQKEMLERSVLKDSLKSKHAVGTKDESDFIKKKVLVHTADTCPGSSGGIVIAVGDDSKIRGGYSKAFIHLQGLKSELMKLQTDSDNINISTLIGWI